VELSLLQPGDEHACRSNGGLVRRVQEGYCNPEIDQLIEQQSREGNPERRKPILWEIERRLAADIARPILFYASGASCRQPWVKGFTRLVNSHFNGWRMEDVWLDR
jgi:peptide/nickel transport system substrate-binding protein